MTGTQPEIRPMGPDDTDGLVALLLEIPAGEHMFVKASIPDAASAWAWLDETVARYVLAVIDGTVAGAAALVPGSGWSSHVSEMRLVVSPRYRRRGLAKALALATLRTAVEGGTLIVTVDALAEQQRVIDLFLGLGFVPEALLTDHVQDADGGLHDLVTLAHSVRGAAAGMATLGVLDAG